MTTEEQLDWMGGACWFCGRRPPVEGKSSTVRMGKMSGAGQFLNSTVSVPRCAECHAGHGRILWAAMAVMLVGAGAVIAALAIWASEMPFWGMAIAALFGAAPGVLVLRSRLGLPADVKSESHGATHPAVIAMVRGGWILDDQEMRRDAEAAARKGNP